VGCGALTHPTGTPEEWELVPLRELGQWSGGGTPSKAKHEYWTNGTIPWVSPKDMKTDHIADSEDHITNAAIEGSTAKLIPSGSVLIVTRSGILSHTLPVAVTTVPVTVNQDLKVLTPKAGVLPDYVAWALRCFAREILKTCSKQGTTVSSIETAALQRFSIPAPPLDQQKRIVAEIEKQFSRLDEAVASLKRVKANLKRYKAAVLKAAVEGRLVETEAELARREGRSYETGEQLRQRILETRRSQWQGKGNYKEPAAPDTTDLPELPGGWVWATLPQLGELSRGKSKHRPRDDKKLYVGPYPFIQTGDVRKSEGTITEYSQTYSEFGLNQSRLWPAGTLCITIAANIAETGILKFAACFPDSVVGFLVDDGATTTRYVEYFIRTAREELERFAPATAQKNINLEVLEAVAIPLPPLAEQERIVAEVDRRLSLLRETEAQVDVNLQRAERLRQAMLGKAFSGSLPQIKEMYPSPIECPGIASSQHCTTQGEA
jgi:type I restriction enzyme S subunit